MKYLNSTNLSHSYFYKKEKLEIQLKIVTITTDKLKNVCVAFINSNSINQTFLYITNFQFHNKRGEGNFSK